MPCNFKDIRSAITNNQEEDLRVLLGNILPEERKKVSERLWFIVYNSFKRANEKLNENLSVKKDVIKMLLPFIDAGAEKSYLFRSAVLENRQDLAELLLPFSDPRSCKEEALITAAMNGNISMLNFLLPLMDPSTKKNRALISAAAHGHLEAVKILLPFSEPTAKKSQALTEAATIGATDICRLLLPLSDAKAHSSRALQMAVINESEELIALLLPHSSPEKALRALKSPRNSYSYLDYDMSLLERVVKSNKTKKKIKEKISNISPAKAPSKPRKF